MIIDKNKILLAPVRFVDSILDRICAVLGALAMAQFPQYLSQYIQRLGGHADEAARNLDKYKDLAESVGKTLHQYVQYLLNSKDTTVFKTGQKIALDLERSDHLANALKELTSAPTYQKLFVFIKNIDIDIARKTLENYTFGLPLNLEGAVYAGAGIVIGMAAYFLISRLILVAIKKIAMRKKNLPASLMF